jgi:hypothetical protein
MDLRYFSTRRLISAYVLAPFFSPKVSQARLHGRIEEVAKNPPPTMTFSG